MLTAVCVAAWYAVAYYGAREWQRHGLFGEYAPTAEERFIYWALSPFPLCAPLFLYCAARRAVRAVAFGLQPLAVWMFR